ncbi:MAG: sensor histidine kinase/response regulator, partial [Caulobacteraceae bacterium]|nr:sensor histidine kinase/response regulator [Caulobacteraceae bacterium]
MDRDRLELALAAAGLGELEWDIGRDVLIISERLAAITGVPAGEIPAEKGAALDHYLHADDLEGVRKARAEGLARGDAFQIVYRYVRPDGRAIWLRCSLAMIRDAGGEPVAISGLVADISARRQEEDQRQALMVELDHRVKNVLATVQALAIQTAKRTTSLDGFLQTFGGRLKAMASANELLTAAR